MPLLPIATAMTSHRAMMSRTGGRKGRCSRKGTQWLQRGTRLVVFDEHPAHVSSHKVDEHKHNPAKKQYQMLKLQAQRLGAQHTGQMTPAPAITLYPRMVPLRGNRTKPDSFVPTTCRCSHPHSIHGRIVALCSPPHPPYVDPKQRDRVYQLLAHPHSMSDTVSIDMRR
jgi:hypothetical protein